jgi:hypothetical protein
MHSKPRAKPKPRATQCRLSNSVHTRLGHSGSATDPALVGPPQSSCTNVLWFDLATDTLSIILIRLGALIDRVSSAVLHSSKRLSGPHLTRNQVDQEIAYD